MITLSFRFFAEYVLAKVTQHLLVLSFLVNVHSKLRTRQQHVQGGGISRLDSFTMYVKKDVRRLLSDR